MNYNPEDHDAECSKCPLQGKTPVPPKGPANPDLVIVSDPPNYAEEQRGEPMVGPGGMVLNDLLRAAGVDRKRVFISPVWLCRSVVPGLEGAAAYDPKTYLAWIRKENKRLSAEAKANKTKFVPMLSPSQCCYPRLLKELVTFDDMAKKRGEPNGIVVIAFGDHAAEATVGKSGIQKIRGSPYEIEL